LRTSETWTALGKCGPLRSPGARGWRRQCPDGGRGDGAALTVAPNGAADLQLEMALGRRGPGWPGSGSWLAPLGSRLRPRGEMICGSQEICGSTVPTGTDRFLLIRRAQQRSHEAPEDAATVPLSARRPGRKAAVNTYLKDVARAHVDLESRETTGSIVLVP